MSFFKLRPFLITFLLLLILAVTFALMLNTLLKKSTVQSYILKQVSRETGYDIRADQMTIRLRKGLGIGLHGVTVSEKAEIKSFAASKVGVYFSISKLLRGNLDIDRIFLLQPRLTLDILQEDNGSKSVNVDSIKKTLAPIIEKIPSISIEEGRIQFQDTPYSVSGLSLDISKKISTEGIRLHLEAESGRLEELHLGRIEADCAFRNGTFLLNQAIVKGKHGRLNFKGQVKTEETFFSGEVELVQYPVRRLIEKFFPESGILEGDMTLQGSFNMKGPTISELVSGLNGTFDLQLSKGTFKKKSVFFKILNLFDVKKLFVRKNKALLQNGMSFHSLLGHINIKSGIMRLEDFQIKSPLFNAVGRGTINLKDETVDSVIGVEPLGKITSQIDKIPLSGYVLSNKVKSLMTYYFYVKGPLGDPEVTSFNPTKLPKDMIRALGKLFLSPVRLFKGKAKEEE
jgi:uncharacterized protein YhdP